jgi:hypothetical protein
VSDQHQNKYKYSSTSLAAVSAARSTPAAAVRPFVVRNKFEPEAPPWFDATEVEDPNLVELPAGRGAGGALLFYTVGVATLRVLSWCRYTGLSSY